MTVAAACILTALGTPPALRRLRPAPAPVGLPDAHPDRAVLVPAARRTPLAEIDLDLVPAVFVPAPRTSPEGR